MLQSNIAKVRSQGLIFSEENEVDWGRNQEHEAP